LVASIRVRDDFGVLLLMMASAAAMACFVASDGDLGFHLATGREVLRTGHIPARNVLSYTQPEHVWLLHQWLPGVLFELLWRRFDIAGVIALKMGVVAATWGVAYATACTLGASALAAGLACTAAAMASAFRFEARPYLFTHLTLALSMWCIARALRARAAGADARAAFVAMTLVALVATHVHAGALDSFIVMAIAAVGCLVQPSYARVVGVPRGLAGAKEMLPFVASLLAAAALAAATITAYHPNGIAVLREPFDMGVDTYMSEHLIEFRSPWRLPLAMLYAYWIWLGLTLLTLAVRARTLHAALIGITLAYALLALRFSRMAYASALVSAPIVAAAWTHAPPAFAAHVRPALRKLAFAALLAIAPLYVYRDHSPGVGYSSRVWPRDHFAFIRSHAIRGRAYVSNAWSGPFLGFFYPERTSFFDARLDAYSPEFVRDVFQRVAYGKPGWDAVLDHYKVEIALLRYTTEGELRLQHGAPNLRQRLAADPRWTLVRFDDDGELFVRSAGANAALAAHLGMPCVDPDRRRFTSAPAGCAAALLRAVREEGNRSPALLLTTALALADAGQPAEAVRLADQAVRADPSDPWAQRAQSFAHCIATAAGGCTHPW
jgi:hypothetical protein